MNFSFPKCLAAFRRVDRVTGSEFKGIPVIAKDRRRILGVVVSGWMLSFGVRLVYPSLAEYIRVDFAASNTVIGGLFTILMVSYGLMQFPSGLISDRIGERTVLLYSLIITTFGCTLLSTSPSFWIFALGCVTFGIGTGLYMTPQFSILSRIFPARSGTVHGIAFAAGGLGTVLPVLATVIATRSSWRLGFGFVIPGLLLTIFGVWRLIPSDDRENQGDSLSISGQVKPIIKHVGQPSMILPLVAVFCVGAVYQSLTAFLPTYLIEIKNISPFVTTILYGFFFAVGITSQIFLGYLGDSHSIVILLIVSSLISGLGLLAILVSDAIIFVGVMMVPISFISGFVSVSNTYFIEQLPSDIQGGGLGLFRSGILVVVSFAPPVAGYFADQGLFDEVFLGCGFLLIIATVINSFHVLRTHCRSILN